MNDQLEMIPGSTRDHGLSQFFTPPKLAAKLVDWALVGSDWGRRVGGFQGARVLEPSAGNGAIVRELVKAGAEVYAVEVDPRYESDLIELSPEWVFEGDFLKFNPAVGRVYDLCVGNFPFHLDETGEFTLHALKFCPRVCAIYPANFPFSEQRIELWKEIRPTRIANISRRPWPGATDYVALEIERRFMDPAPRPCSVEWWNEAWR